MGDHPLGRGASAEVIVCSSYSVPDTWRGLGARRLQVNAILSIWPLLGMLGSMAAAVAAALACYALLRPFASSAISAESERFASTLIARLGTLHALILALMLAQEMADYRIVGRIVSLESSAISNVYYDLEEYEAESPGPGRILIDMLVRYVESALHEDPATLATRVSRRGWAHHRHIDQKLRELQPVSEFQRDLRSQMLADWESISEYRTRLETATNNRMPFLFWLVAISGFFAVVIPCFVYSPKPQHLAILSVFAAFNGIVMYVIFAVANPFTGPGAIESQTVLRSLLETMRGVGP